MAGAQAAEAASARRVAEGVVVTPAVVAPANMVVPAAAESLERVGKRRRGGGGGGGQRGDGARSLLDTGGGGGGATANALGTDGGGTQGGDGGYAANVPGSAAAPMGGGGGGASFAAGGNGANSGGGGGTGFDNLGAGGTGGIGGGGGGGTDGDGGGSGRFGGGGGTGNSQASAGMGSGGTGGFGGGGGGARTDALGQPGGDGGFGGGGGGGIMVGAGGLFGGAGGAGNFANGGGGAALGGAVFLAQGGQLMLDSTSFTGSYSVTAGTGFIDGDAVGPLAFLMPGTTLTNSVGPSLTRTLPDVIAGSGGLSKTGAGTLILSANNTYTGATTVSGGTLRIDGTQTGSDITVQSGGTLQGTGTVFNVTVNAGGTLAPGASPGILSLEAITLQDDSTLAIELNSVDVAGVGYDQINATFEIKIAGAILSVTLAPGFFPPTGQQFRIVNRHQCRTAGSDGTFDGLPEAGTLTVGGQSFSISYVGGVGSNDIVLTALEDGPIVSAIADTAILEDTMTGAIAFTIGDEAPGAVIVAGSSSNDTLVPDANVVIGGSGADRTVTVTPLANQFGSTTITITADDGPSATIATFVLTVNPVNDAPMITDIVNQTIDENNPTGALPFTIGDLETAAGALTVSGTSANTVLVPDANVVVGGAGANRTVTITPAANTSGTATITITVGDGITTAIDTFTVTVNAVNERADHHRCRCSSDQ